MQFCPGGLAPTGFRPIVVMCRNLLPFEWREMSRYGMSWQFLRLLFLRRAQAETLRRADGVIFLTRYAQDAVLAVTGPIAGKTSVIPHGINECFFCQPRLQRPVSRDGSSLRIVYVSIVDVYKHQWHVAEAVVRLRREGLPVELEVTGPAYPPALRRLEATMRRHDPAGSKPEAVLHSLKTYLAKGFPFIFGFSVYNSIEQAEANGKIPFPSPRERMEGGHAVMAVGYDDTLEITNKFGNLKTKGALLIRNSWGTTWGDHGYGWLPYDYVLRGLAED
ncbi:MAG: C1 family peptidase, partial [Sedimentisphaerales bacterium]|nr:C1 family peptidase [Sedimentisphaerales bacterium]